MSYLLLAAVPAGLWVAANPVTGGAIVAIGVVALLGARHVRGLVRCLVVCRQLTVDLGGVVEVTVTRPTR